MKAEVTKLPKSEVELKIEVPAQEWQEFLTTAAKELSRDLKIEGFRPGFAPLKLVEEKIGLTRILEEAAEHCVRKSYVKAVLDNNIEAIGQPQISILKMAKDNPFEFKAKVAVMPEVMLPDYKKIASELKKNKVLVEEREVEQVLQFLQRSRAKFSQKSGPSQKGDWVEIEYSSSQIENGKKIEDAFILGEGHFIPGFEEKIEGLEAGQEKEFLLSFPKESLQKDLAGQEINFKVKLKSVQKIEFPEINDAFAKGLGNFEDLSALKKNLTEGINTEKEMAESQRLRQEILDKIAAKSRMETPAILINNLKEQTLVDLKQEVAQKLGISFEDYLKKINKTEKELLDSFSAEAEKKVRNSLTLREISKKEKIEVSKEEVEEEVGKILKNQPPHQPIDADRLRDYTKEVIINDKTLAKLESLAS